MEESLSDLENDLSKCEDALNHSNTRLTEERKAEIQESLRLERERRRQCISQGQLFSIDNLDLTGSVAEDQPLQIPDVKHEPRAIASQQNATVSQMLEERDRKKSTPQTPRNPISTLLAEVQQKLENQLEEQRSFRHTPSKAEALSRISHGQSYENISDFSPDNSVEAARRTSQKYVSGDGTLSVGSPQYIADYADYQLEEPELLEIEPQSQDLDVIEHRALPPQPYGNRPVAQFESPGRQRQMSGTRGSGQYVGTNEPDFEKLATLYDSYVVQSPQQAQPTTPPRKKSISPVKRQAASAGVRTPKSHAGETYERDRDSILYTRSKDAIKHEQEQKFKTECTFQPKINRLPSMYNKGAINVAREERMKRLAQNKNDVWKQREKQRRAELEKDDECTFQPKINVRRTWSERSIENQDDAAERLHSEAMNRAHEREKTKRIREEEEAALYPFQPQVQGTTAKLAGKKAMRPPIYQRLGEMHKEKNENMQRLIMESEKEEQLTFQPSLNKTSEKIAKVRRMVRQEEEQSIVDRLHRQAEESNQRKAELAQAYMEEEREIYTFQPQTSVMSNPYSSIDSCFANPEEFYERQVKHQKRMAEKRDRLVDKHQDKHCTFEPQINTKSSEITDNKRIGESSNERFERMCNQEVAKRQEKLDQKMDEVYSGYTHQPKINDISKALGRSVVLDELAYNESGKKRKKLLTEENAAAEESEYLYRPMINQTKKYSGVRAFYGQDQDIMRNIEDRQLSKQQKLEDIKRRSEYDEMKNCTFAPECVGPQVNLEEEVEVKGLETFLEQRQRAKRIEEERREREEKVFFTNLKELDPDHHYTVPQPFQLHPSTKNNKISKLKAEMEEKEKTECTFQPNTVESRNRSAISRMIESQSHSNYYV